jgi:hypothetical protein
MGTSIIELLEAYPSYEIYCDMDGVLTNFEKRFMDVLHKDGNKYYSKKELEGITRPKHFQKKFGEDEFWKLVDEMGEEFWAGMEWMPNGEELWRFISPFSPKILSSPSKDNSSRLGKRMWIREHLNPNKETGLAAPSKIIFALSENKQDYATPKSILIDDKPSNIEQWEAQGGIAMKVKDGEIQSVIEKLKELGYNEQSTKKRI